MSAIFVQTPGKSISTTTAKGMKTGADLIPTNRMEEEAYDENMTLQLGGRCPNSTVTTTRVLGRKAPDAKEYQQQPR